ncbi:MULTISPECIES: DUF1702 family protein [unclassified Nonomuraea]|uniref:DUF1702 family protein n=1 Tax=Nonomuraea sp. NPDC003804 TaxID=3154547 RepID=UPI0033B86C60
MTATLLRRALALDPARLTLARLGFPQAAPGVRDRLDEVVRSFVRGYNDGLTQSSGPLDLSGVTPEFRGFAYEGAAMSRCLLDVLSLSGGRRLRDLREDRGAGYIHLITVGAGWAYARLRLPVWRLARPWHPLLGWLAWDGWGFHQAFFRPEAVFGRQWIERAARGPVRAIRDQGVGRALWFYGAAEPERVAATIERFAPERRGDLWAGIGLAATYTGALAADGVDDLAALAASHRADLAQGAAFAAKAHHLSGIEPAGTAIAVERLTGADLATAAAWTDRAFEQVVSLPSSTTAYEAWRARIRHAWAEAHQAKETT